MRVPQIITDDKKQGTVWKNKQFAYLRTGNLLSELSFSFFTFWLPVVIYFLTESTLAMGTMRAIQFLPNIILGIFIGVIIDKLDRKKIMLTSTLGIIFLLTFLFILITTGNLEVWHIYIVGFAIFTLSYTLGASYDTILPLIVDKKQLIKANSTLSLVDSSIVLFGPMLAGLTFLINIQTGLLISIIGMIIMYLCSRRINLRIDEKKLEKRKKTNFIDEFKEGLTELFRNNVLFTLTIMILFINIASAASGAVLVFYALDHFKVSSQILGVIFTCSAMGGIAASLIANKLDGRLNIQTIFPLSLLILSIGFLINSLTSSWIGLSMGLFLTGAATLIINIHYISYRQKTTDSRLLGRVSGTSSMIMKLATPLSFLSAGFLAEYIKINYIFLTSSIIMLLLSVVILLILSNKVKKGVSNVDNLSQ